MCSVNYTATCERVCARDNEQALKMKRKNKRRKDGGGKTVFVILSSARSRKNSLRVNPGVATAWTDFFPESLTKTILSFCKLHCSTSTSGVRGDGRNKNHFLPPPTPALRHWFSLVCSHFYIYLFIFIVDTTADVVGRSRSLHNAGNVTRFAGDARSFTDPRLV